MHMQPPQLSICRLHTCNICLHATNCMQACTQYRTHTFAKPTHTPPPQDAPRHFLQGAPTIDQLPAAALVGPADVIDVPDDTNVTAAALAALQIPEDAQRLLFRTANTKRQLMAQTPFATDYVGLDSTAAQWLAKERPGVVLVGIDYLSIGMLEDIEEAHKQLFRKVRRDQGVEDTGVVAA